MTRDAGVLDRAVGVLVTSAGGDALGAPYELGERHVPAPDEPAAMTGGGLGPYGPGEWTDDTDMALCVARVAREEPDLAREKAQDKVALALAEWFGRPPPDFGAQIGTVLSRAGRRPTAQQLRAQAAHLHALTGRTAGKAALVRTVPVALAHLDDPERTATAARALAELTHPDPLAADACVLWSALVGEAVRTGRLDPSQALRLLPEQRRDLWAGYLDEGASRPPSAFRDNGFSVRTVQAAWSAVLNTTTPQDDPGQASYACLHLQHAVQSAVRAGGNTDTVAALTGSLVGGIWGASAVPAQWRLRIHGWPGWTAADLTDLATALATRGEPPSAVITPARNESVHRLDGDSGVCVDISGRARPRRGQVAVDVYAAAGEPLAAGYHVLSDRNGCRSVPFDIAGALCADDEGRVAFVVDDAAREIAMLRDSGNRVLVRARCGDPLWVHAVADRYLRLSQRHRGPDPRLDPRMTSLLATFGQGRTAPPPVSSQA